MNALRIGSSELGMLVLLWVAAGVGAAFKWKFRQFCSGAFAVPMVVFVVFTWPLGPLALLAGGLALWSRRRLQQPRNRTAPHEVGTTEGSSSIA